MYKAVEVRLPQIDTELSNLQVKIKVQKAIIDKLNEQMKGLMSSSQSLLQADIQPLQDLVLDKHRLRQVRHR